MFVSILLLVVESVLSTSATVSPIKVSVRASRIRESATHVLCENEPRSSTCEYQRRHHPDGPKHRCSIHDRPTCPFSAGDGAYAEHRKGPRPVVYKINSRLRHFGYGTGQITGLTAYYIAPRPHDAPRGSANSRAHNDRRWAQ